MDKNILSIAGLDPSGCAGITADLKAFRSFGVHGLSVLTTITAQNTEKVDGVFRVNHETIHAQLKSVASDIEIHAVKIGLLPDSKTLEFVAGLCQKFHLTNIVVDPILSSTTGYKFGNKQMIEAYKHVLFPIADVVTPNLQEASMLSGLQAHDLVSMKDAAAVLAKSGPKNVVVTGGHLEEEAVDLWFDGSQYREFRAPKIESENGRGTGCTFSSILAIHLARKIDLATAIIAAKEYIGRGLVHSYKIGKGRGPLGE